MFWKAAGMFGILVAGILIGAFGPIIFQHRLDTSWHELHTKGPAFGFSYDSSVIFSDLPLPTIRSVSGRAKFLNPVGPGEATPLGYVVTVEMAPLDMSKVPERYKRENSEKINGVPVTYSALSDKAYYEIAFNFDLKDKDGFILKTLHAKPTDELASGTKNVFQAAADGSVDYNTAEKITDIWVRPSLEKCVTCMAPAS